MKKEEEKSNTAPPLLCWDIYSEWLYEKFGVPAKVPQKQVKKKVQEK